MNTATRSNTRAGNRDGPLLRALGGETVSPPPIWLMRQAGRYLPEYREVRKAAGGFLALCHAPDLAAEATLQPVRRFGLDAAIVFSDILLVPHALGQDVRFEEGKGPVLDAIRARERLKSLDTAGLGERLSSVYAVLERVSLALPDAVSLIGFAGAPWTVATYMVEGGSSRDFAIVKGWAFSDERGFGELVDVLVDATAEHLAAQADAGADVLQIFDTWAGVLPPAQFVRWCVEPVAEIVSRVRRRCPGVPVIGFPRGAGMGYETYARATGVDAVGIDGSVPLHWAASVLQDVCAVQGNLDPVSLLVGGEAMVAHAREIVSVLGKGPFVFNLGHGVLKTTPPEHVSDLVAAVRAF